MKTKRLLILLLSLLSVETLAQEKVGHFFAAAGTIYGLGSLRLGRGPVEFGLLNSRAFGVNGLLREGMTYGAFGVIVNYQASPGIYGGVGLQVDGWRFVGLRMELNGTVSIDGTTHGEGLIGLSLFI